VIAVTDASLEVKPSTTVSILGANGAGKSSILRAVIGLVGSTGRIDFWGQDVRGMAVYRRSLLGMQLVPEGRRVFSGIPVEGNLLAGAFNHRNDSPGIQEDLDKIFDMFPVLRERRRQKAGTLSGGEQQMLAIGRSLMARPKLLMMDEPTMGLAPIIIEQLSQSLLAIKRSGVTILLVEQNARLALDISDFAYFIQNSKIVMEGAASKMKEDPRIRKVYLGI
jgi:branched-chain amino acid transport system ATP-binding protein